MIRSRILIALLSSLSLTCAARASAAPASVQDPPQTAPKEASPPANGPLAEVERRNVAVVLVIDRSGSMGEGVPGTPNSKMSYAKTSALETARALAEGDLVGIVTFGNRNAGRIELPLTQATERKTVEQKVGQLAHANEYTYLLSGLQRAREMLANNRLPVRHLVVISDGDIVLEEKMALIALVRQLKREGVTVSIVQIAGSSTSNFQIAAAEEITQTGGGRYLPLDNAAKVPVFVSSEVVSALAQVGRRPAGTEPGPAEGEKPATQPAAGPSAADVERSVRDVTDPFRGDRTVSTGPYPLGRPWEDGQWSLAWEAPDATHSGVILALGRSAGWGAGAKTCFALGKREAIVRKETEAEGERLIVVEITPELLDEAASSGLALRVYGARQVDLTIPPQVAAGLRSAVQARGLKLYSKPMK